MIRSEEQPSFNSVTNVGENISILDKKIQPFRVSFDHITYSVKTRKKDIKNLLDDVSASLEPGKLTAIIGASGAGKVSINFQPILCLYLQIFDLLDNFAQYSCWQSEKRRRL